MTAAHPVAAAVQIPAIEMLVTIPTTESAAAVLEASQPVGYVEFRTARRDSPIHQPPTVHASASKRA